MTTRFYFPSGTGAPPITPPPSVGFDRVTAALRRSNLGISKISSPMLTLDFSDTYKLNAETCIYQAVGPLLVPGQVIVPFDGNTMTFDQRQMRASVRWKEPNKGNNMKFVIFLRIVNGNNESYNFGNVTNEGEFSTGLTSRFAQGLFNGFGYTTVDGDRIVAEMGTWGDPTGSGDHSCSFRIGDSAISDLPQADASVEDLNPWVEVTADLLFQ